MMASGFTVTQIESASLSPVDREALVTLCSTAYEEPFAPYFADIGPGTHLLGAVGGTIVSHVMWVPRTLYVDGIGALSTAYIEAVATLPAWQGHGFASRLMRELPPRLSAFDLAALSPSDEAWYARLGWAPWRGPTFVREHGETVATPGEDIMILRLPRTPAALDLTAPIACDWRPGEVW